MWTVDKLRQVVEERGETLPRNDHIAEALLAHERFKGRTEESYQKARAAREMDRLLDTYKGPFPARKANEYPGLTQLRVYAEDRAQMREAEQVREAAATAPKPEPEQSDSGRSLKEALHQDQLARTQEAYADEMDHEEDEMTR